MFKNYTFNCCTFKSIIVARPYFRLFGIYEDLIGQYNYVYNGVHSRNTIQKKKQTVISIRCLIDELWVVFFEYRFEFFFFFYDYTRLKYVTYLFSGHYCELHALVTRHEFRTGVSFVRYYRQYNDVPLYALFKPTTPTMAFGSYRGRRTPLACRQCPSVYTCT